MFSMSSSLKIYISILISPKQFYGVFRAIIKTHSRMSGMTHSQSAHLKFNLLNLFSSYCEFSRRLSPLNSGRILSYSSSCPVSSLWDLCGQWSFGITVLGKTLSIANDSSFYCSVSFDHFSFLVFILFKRYTLCFITEGPGCIF